MKEAYSVAELEKFARTSLAVSMRSRMQTIELRLAAGQISIEDANEESRKARVVYDDIHASIGMASTELELKKIINKISSVF